MRVRRSGRPIVMARLTGCRRPYRRYERKAESFLAFTSIGCTLICCRKARPAESFRVIFDLRILVDRGHGKRP